MSLQADGASLRNLVVIGSGQAGFQVAASLRELGFAGRISLIGDEAGLPYHRPPLSKAFLSGNGDRTELFLCAESFLTTSRIDLVRGRATRLDRSARQVTLADGQSLPYDHLVLATGARNRSLQVPGVDIEGVLQLRSIEDADLLRRSLPGLVRVVVIGAGFIGLELAAFAAALGIEVTVLEMTARPLARALSEFTSDFVRNEHQKMGVRFIFNARAARIQQGPTGRVGSVETDDGRVLPADLVVVGVGAVPNAELAEHAALPVDGGVVVDDRLRTEDSAISAIGDCAAFPMRSMGGSRGRIESVQNAVDQARCVAARLTGNLQPFAAVPWFWSDQGPIKLRIAGLPVPHDRYVVRGDPGSGAFSVFCFRDGKLAGVESINKLGDHMIARKLLACEAVLDPDEVADPTFHLKARVGAPAGKN